jgi:hypothetical protein
MIDVADAQQPITNLMLHEQCGMIDADARILRSMWTVPNYPF